jgi:hypothetical protein
VSFADLNPQQRRRIAAMGGRAAQRKGTGHRFTSDEARAAAARRVALDADDPKRVAERLRKSAETAARRANSWIKD